MAQTLTSKQRAFLRAQANALTPILHIGKETPDEAVFKQADDALTARELIKGRVLETSALSVAEVAETVAARVEATLVHTMGRTFVLYRRNDKQPKIVLPR